MKVLRKIKEEKGSITMTVVAAMLFIISAVLIAYFSLSNQSNDQSKKTRQIADSYKVTNTDLVQKYKDVQDNFNEVTTMSIAEVKSLGNTMFAKGTNTTVTDDSGNKFIVPAGFKVTEDADNVTEGMVVQDKDGNEFVWIPVSSSDLAKMYESGNTEYTLYGTNVKTTYKSITTTLGNRALYRKAPGTELYVYTEPDVVSIDTEQTYQTQASFNDLTDMATKLKDDYIDMIESLKKFGGFYVGRYELGKDSSNNPQVKAGTVMNNMNWYNLYSACKSFSRVNVKSRMIWGCQWDQVCRFINEYGDKVSLDDSRTYGNYNDSIGDAAIDSGWNNFNNTTGRNLAWRVNNIYDIAGNCWEWTQEAFLDGFRAIRGRLLL